MAAAGDIHHFEGVASVEDPLWMTDYELVYSHPELMLEWYPILGNHEYRGNTQAVLDYGGVSRRWVMPAGIIRKRSKWTTTHRSGWYGWIRRRSSTSTTKRPKNPTATLRHRIWRRRLRWIDSTLTASDETWKIVIGHHPIYADTDKDEEERLDLQERLDTILRRHGVDMYICGHIHNFQHIRRAGSDVDYVVNTSGSLSRDVRPIEGTLFLQFGHRILGSVRIGRQSEALHAGQGQEHPPHRGTRTEQVNRSEGGGSGLHAAGRAALSVSDSAGKERHAASGTPLWKDGRQGRPLPAELRCGCRKECSDRDGPEHSSVCS